MADQPPALHRLATSMGVATHYQDGLGQSVDVGADTLVAVCAALGAAIDHVDGADDALRALSSTSSEPVPPVVLAWDGEMRVAVGDGRTIEAEVSLEQGGGAGWRVDGSAYLTSDPLPPGCHRLRVDVDGHRTTSTIISAPRRAWRPAGARPRWGVAAQLGALRSSRSRSVGDLADLMTLGHWIGDRGGDVVSLLPLLPTFNDAPAEPSPYSPVSRLFWSELMLDLGDEHRPVASTGPLSFAAADREVRAALDAPSTPSSDHELARYASFRGAQARHGRDWRSWPSGPRHGRLGAHDIDAGEAQFHLVAQTLARDQVGQVRQRLEAIDVRLGLDLAVGVHPEGYDAWSRPQLFAEAMAVGAPPDAGFPTGQSWGFPPILPDASRREGHAYVAASVAHQAAAAGVLRIDHVMAMTRLYWIPQGMDLDRGTYVRYPREELFAVLCLESHRHQCELVGENLGTVPADIDEALATHRIWGTYLAQFEAASGTTVAPPSSHETAMIGTHDTPTLAGWRAEVDIDERLRMGLLAPNAEADERAGRRQAVAALASALGVASDDPAALLDALVDWLGGSISPLVVVWIEDLWLETDAVNLPGTSSAERPNWQRPMRRLLEQALADPVVISRADRLHRARHAQSPPVRAS